MTDRIHVPVSKGECCGCSICAEICPVTAIEMKEDDEGFVYPIVDESKCIKCGKCLRCCAFSNSTKDENNDLDPAYYAKYNDINVRMKSQSGAVFFAVSDYILKNKGVVYGCILDNENNVRHIRADNLIDRDKMCRSKYVISDIKGITSSLSQDLLQGKSVLFTGTGCQVDAVRKYIIQKDIDSSKLYTLDIVCHGCASPRLFKDYISFLEKKYKGMVSNFVFRDKEICGWDGHIETFIIGNKKYKSTFYREIFHTDLCIRPSCYNCKYCKINRGSDLTIADAWGIKKVLPEFNDNRGASLVICHSEKGKKLISEISDVCLIETVDIKETMQPNLKNPTECKGNREEFWKIYKDRKIDGIVKKYGHVSLKRKIVYFIKYKARQVLQSHKYYLP